MNLYYFEIGVNGKTITAVVCANDDEKAFELAEIEIEKQFIKQPSIEEMVLLEKKKIGKGAAFVIE